MKNGKLIQLIKEVKEINWDNEEEVKTILGLSDNIIDILLSFSGETKQLFLELIRHKNSFNDPKDFEYAIKSLELYLYNSILSKNAREDFIMLLYNKAIINKDYYKDLIKKVIELLEIMNSTLLIHILNDERVTSNPKLDNIVSILLKLAQRGKVGRMENVWTLCKNESLNKNPDYFDFALDLAVKKSDTKIISILTNPVLLNRPNYKDAVMSIINNKYLNTIDRHLRNNESVLKGKDKLFYEDDYFKYLKGPHSTIAFMKLYNSYLKDIDKPKYEFALKLFKNLKDDLNVECFVKLATSGNIIVSNKYKEILSISTRIKNPGIFELYIKVVSNKYLRNSKHFRFIANTVADLKNEDVIQRILNVINKNFGVLDKPDFRENVLRGLKITDGEDASRYFALLVYAPFTNSKYYNKVMKLVNKLVDNNKHIFALVSATRLDGMLDDRLYDDIINIYEKYDEVPEDLYYLFRNLTKAYVCISYDKASFAISNVMTIKNLTTYKIKEYTKATINRDLIESNYYELLLKSINSFDENNFGTSIDILTNKCVIKYGDYENILKKVIGTKDSDVLDYWCNLVYNLSIDSYEEDFYKFCINNAFRLNNIEECILFNKLFFNNLKVFNQLSPETIHKVINIIVSGNKSEGYNLLDKVLGIILPSELLVDLLQMISQGKYTEEDIKNKLGGTNEYSKFKNEVLEKSFPTEKPKQTSDICLNMLEGLNPEDEVNTESILRVLRPRK